MGEPEMIERVARAIWDKCLCDYCDTDASSPLPSDCCCLLAARAAIVAMRKPTEIMFMKGGDTPPSNQGRDHLGSRRSNKRIGDLAAKEAWITMINAALK